MQQGRTTHRSTSQRGLLSAIAVTIVLMVAASAALYLHLRAPAPYDEYVADSPDSLASNTALAERLVANGILDPFVDVTAQQVYVAYEFASKNDEPTDDELTESESFQLVALLTAHEFAGAETKIVLLQTSGETPITRWTATGAQVAAFLAQPDASTTAFVDTLERVQY